MLGKKDEQLKVSEELTNSLHKELNYSFILTGNSFKYIKKLDLGNMKFFLARARSSRNRWVVKSF